VVSSAYADLIEDELNAERQRRGVIDTRAASVVSTSGGLVALLAAVGAFVGTGRSSPLPDTAFNLILWVLGAFALASICGILAGWTMPYKVANVDALEELRTKYWNDDETVARTTVAKLRLDLIERFRLINKWKERFLRAGWICQLGGLILAAAAVRILLIDL
jgi:hypothetical protein